MKVFRKYIYERRDVIIASVVTFLLCYALVMFNRIDLRDEMANTFGIGVSVSSGRWTLWLIKRFIEAVMGNNMWSLPMLNGFFVMLHITMAACLMVDSFGLVRRMSRILFPVLLVSFPGMICMMGYTFTAPAYSLGILFAALCGVLTVKWAESGRNGRKRWFLFAGGIIFGALSLGIYQSYISFALVIMLTALVRYTSGASLKEAFLGMGKMLISLFGTMALYLGIMKLFLVTREVELNSYKGMDSAFSLTPGRILERLGVSYKEFALPSRTDELNLFPFHSWWVYEGLLWLSLLMLVIFVIKKWKSLRNKPLLLLLAALFPPAMNVTYLLTDSGYYAMMFYPAVMVFGVMLAIWEMLSAASPISEKLGQDVAASISEKPGQDVAASISEKTPRDAAPDAPKMPCLGESPDAPEEPCRDETPAVPEAGTEKDRTAVRDGAFRKGIYVLALAGMCFIGFMSIRYANQLEMKGIVLKNQYTSFLTTLITRIQSTEGYTQESKVLLTNTQHVKTLDLWEEYTTVQLAPYVDNPLKYSKKNKKRMEFYLQQWCGFDAVYVTEDELKDRKVLKKMPSFPEDGSIRVIDGIIVVKF